jgi:hypothetical protein
MSQAEQPAEHDGAIRGVYEENGVTLHLSNGETIEAECIHRSRNSADERSGEIRTTYVWTFDIANSDRLATVSIVDGLRSSEDDPEFPVHKKLSTTDKLARDGDWQKQGYITTVENHAAPEVEQ